MTKIIPNEESYICFAPNVANISAPTAAEITAGVNLTGLTISLTATAQGNTVPTPAFDSLFETSVPGTVQGQFSADFYRDDENDTAWETLPRMTKGYFIISRFGGEGANHAPIANNKVEVWPVLVTSRAAAAMTSNQAQTFTVAAAVVEVPAEDAVVGA